MSLAKLSINRPVFAWMLMTAFIVFGLVSFTRLGISELPDVDFPMVNISATFDGATPEVMESDVVDVIENAVMGVQGLRDIQSTSRYGAANITLEFDIDRSVDIAMQEVQSKVQASLKDLPEDIDPPIVTKINPEDQPIIWLALSGDVTQRELMTYARDRIVNQFQLVPGVGDVTFGGFIEPNIRIWIDATKLSLYELSVQDIMDALKKEHIEIPAGTLQKGEKEFTLRVVGEAMTPQEMSRISINTRGGKPNYQPITLGQIARVEAGTEDIRRKSRVMGERAVGIAIRKQRGTNAVAIAQAVKLKLAAINKTLPAGYKLGVNFDSTRFIEHSVHELQKELLLASVFTGIVCLLFLGSFGSTFNILLAIPTSIIGALAFIKLFGFTLNTFTFLGLILAVGIVVDDAIMVLENIVRHGEMGKSKRQAALDGTNQITFAAVATTLAIMAIFLPVTFMDGVIGKFFFQFGITISAAVGISLVESLTLTPMRCAAFLSLNHLHEKKRWIDRVFDSLVDRYRSTLSFALRWKWAVVGMAVLIFIGSTLLLPGMKKEFIPPQDQGMFLVRLQTPIGSSLEFTDELFLQAENFVAKIPEVNRYFVAVGGFGDINQINTGMMFVTLKEQSERKRSQKEIMNQVRSEFSTIKNLKAIVQDLSTRGFSASRGFPIEFSIRGAEWPKLVQIQNDIIAKLKADKRFVDVDSNYDEGMPEIKIVPMRDRAAAKGISVEEVGLAVRNLVGGDKISRFNENGRRIDVRIRLEDKDLHDPESILRLLVRNNRGELVRLGDVARLENTKSLVSITRQQRERAISIFSNVTPGASQADLVKSIEEMGKTLPAGYSLVLGGSSKAFGESFRQLIFALIFGVIIAYMILASQFNSFIHPVTVLLALPFSLTGAWIALKLGGQSLNIYSMIGFILLMGIVKKNSIMLVDFTNEIRKNENKPTLEALLEACPIRLRPILMTSLAIISAAIPSIIIQGPGAETRIPMSLSVVGGVAVSTFFTLYVVPCAYSIFDQLAQHSSLNPLTTFKKLVKVQFARN